MNWAKGAAARVAKLDLRDLRFEMRRGRRIAALGGYYPHTACPPQPSIPIYRDDMSAADLARDGGLIVPADLLPAGDLKNRRRKDALAALFGADMARLPDEAATFALRELEKAEVGKPLAPEALREIVRVANAYAVVCKADEAGQSSDHPLQIKKYDDELQVVWGEVYIPYLPDSQGDAMTPLEIRKAAWRFSEQNRLGEIDRMHDGENFGAFAVETFINDASKGPIPTFIEDSWVLGVHIPDSQVWAGVKANDFNGFSMAGSGTRVRGEIEMEIPEEVRGRTSTDEDHDHPFMIRFGPEGEFLGGLALKGDTDHEHVIQKGTMTELAGGDMAGAMPRPRHLHRYSFSEAILEVAVGDRR